MGDKRAFSVIKYGIEKVLHINKFLDCAGG
jgi:hypothetical protein